MAAYWGCNLITLEGGDTTNTDITIFLEIIRVTVICNFTLKLSVASFNNVDEQHVAVKCISKKQNALCKKLKTYVKFTFKWIEKCYLFYT